MPSALRYLAGKLLTLIGQRRTARMLEHFGFTRADQYWTLVEQQLDYQHRFAAALDAAQLDVIVCPVCPLPAYTHGASKELGTGGGYAIAYNLLGYPAGVVPFTHVSTNEESLQVTSRDWIDKAAARVVAGSAGLPVGVQVVARPWRDHVSLAVMAALEASAQTRGEIFIPPDTF